MCHLWGITTRRVNNDVFIRDHAMTSWRGRIAAAAGGNTASAGGNAASAGGNATSAGGNEVQYILQ